jgi:hypothetical protein
MSFSAGRALLVLVVACAGGSLAAQSSSTHGPACGHIVLGGGGLNHAIDSAFIVRMKSSALHVGRITVRLDPAGGPGPPALRPARFSPWHTVHARTETGTLQGAAVPLSEFAQLSKILIVICYGDNIPEQPTASSGEDNWQATSPERTSFR